MNDADFKRIGDKCDNGRTGECKRDGYIYCDFEQDIVKCSADEAQNCVEPTPIPTVVPTITPTPVPPAPKVIKKTVRNKRAVFKLENLAQYKNENDKKDNVKYLVLFRKVGDKKVQRKFLSAKNRIAFGKLRSGRYFIKYRVVRVEKREKQPLTNWSKRVFFKIK